VTSYSLLRLLKFFCLPTLALVVLPSGAQPSSDSYTQIPTGVDLRPCFSSILQDKKVSYSNTTFKLAMLSEWSYDTYDSLKRSGELNAIIEDIPVGASYDEATIAVRKMYQKYSVNIDQSSLQVT